MEEIVLSRSYAVYYTTVSGLVKVRNCVFMKRQGPVFVVSKIGGNHCNCGGVMSVPMNTCV